MCPSELEEKVVAGFTKFHHPSEGDQRGDRPLFRS
jgi:hypothetical protein